MMTVTLPDPVFAAMIRGAEIRLQTTYAAPPERTRSRVSLHYHSGRKVSAQGRTLTDALEALAPAAAEAELREIAAARAADTDPV